jgi:hypothetical protein
MTGRRAARSVALLVWLGGSAVQIVIWVLVCVISRRLASPWWLWTVVVGGAVVAVVWWSTRPGRSDRAPTGSEPTDSESSARESQLW